MRRTSLQLLLEQRWMIFSALLAIVFSAISLVTVYLVEDAVIDRRVVDFAEKLVANPSLSGQPPPNFSVFRAEAAPLDIHAQLPFIVPNEPFEMRRVDRHHVHGVLVQVTPHDQLVVIHDVTDLMIVQPRIGLATVVAMLLALVLVTISRFIARAFAKQVGRDVVRLTDAVREAPDAASLREIASKEGVLEFHQLLNLHAEAAEAQVQAMARERETLAYLGHELRTPLQSARTSLELLRERPGDDAALARLDRAVLRLGRASHAALWLASDRPVSNAAAIDLREILQSLVDELHPIAEARHQRLVFAVHCEKPVMVPAEAFEAIFANLLLNAIQHGAPGEIVVSLRDDWVEISNPTGGAEPAQGFGFGLAIVQRLTDRVGGQIAVNDSRGYRTVRFDLSDAPSGVHKAS